MEDIRIGRDTKTSIHTAVISTTPTPIIDASPERTMLIVFPGAAGAITLSPFANMIDGIGIIISGFTSPMVMTIQEYGDIITKQLYVTNATAGTTISWLEGRLAAR